MHKVLVNRLGGLSLARKSVVRLTDRPDMASDVYRGRKTRKQQQQQQQKNSRRGCGGRGSMCVCCDGKGLQLHSEILHCLRTVI